MKRTLSDRLLRSLAQPQKHPQEIWDEQLRSFGCRVSKQGTVSFFVMKRPQGQRKLVRLTLGSYPVLGLGEARTRARDALRELQDGVDPRARKAEEQRREVAKRKNAFVAVAEDFLARHAASKRTAKNIEAIVRRELIRRWGDRPIADIHRPDVVAMVDEIRGRGYPEAARQAYAYARRLFGWAVGRGLIAHSPADHIPKQDILDAKRIRTRVLNEPREIPLLWRATEGPEAAYFGPYARLLLLLGVRRTELGRATWLEFDLDAATWTIPPGRMKSAEPHTVALPPAAVQILRSLPQGGGYVIGGASPIHYSRAKRQLDARMTALNGGKAIPRWTWHDARRTFRTGLSGLKIAPHIAELAIAHGKRGLSRIYDQHEYDAELRHAFEAWARKVMNIVEPPTGTVVPLLRQTT